jgi:hypothetical protein
VSPGPQSRRRTKPIDTALTAAVPISVKTTRRDRFMASPALPKKLDLNFARNFVGIAKRQPAESGLSHGAAQRQLTSLSGSRIAREVR